MVHKYLQGTILRLVNFDFVDFTIPEVYIMRSKFHIVNLVVPGFLFGFVHVRYAYKTLLFGIILLMHTHFDSNAILDPPCVHGCTVLQNVDWIPRLDDEAERAGGHAVAYILPVHFGVGV